MNKHTPWGSLPGKGLQGKNGEPASSGSVCWWVSSAGTLSLSPASGPHVLGRDVCLAEEPRLSEEADTQGHKGGVRKGRHPSFYWTEGKGDRVGRGVPSLHARLAVFKGWNQEQVPRTPSGPGLHISVGQPWCSFLSLAVRTSMTWGQQALVTVGETESSPSGQQRYHGCSP